VRIEFNGSGGPTLGIEVELNLVDATTRALANDAVAIIGELGRGHPDGEHPKVKQELFCCTVEVITGICTTVAEARDDLDGSIEVVRRSAEARGLALICSGTHPFTHWRDLEVSPKERYQDLVASIGWPARRLAICGVHFHVGVPTAEHAAALVSPLAFHLPPFLALSASSPYWHGIDSGLASCRTKVFEGLPTAGLPPRLEDWADFERFMSTLVNAEVISTIREVWWDVRPHPNFGTVELRMCDGITNLSEVAALAAMAQCLVADLSDRISAGEPVPAAREWVLRENKWLAARFGLETSFIVDDTGARVAARDVITDLVEQLTPTARRLGCTAELSAVLDIMDRGPSYQRQRELIVAGATLPDVVDSLVRELTMHAPGA